MKKLFCYAVLSIACATLAFAQDLRTATLVGTVTDPSGAYVANADVTVTNVDTNVVTKSKTNNEGAYYVPFLNLGNYKIAIAVAGFKTFEQTGLALAAGETPRVDVKLQVGAVSDEVRVTAQAALLETDNAVVGGTTSTKEIHDDPIPQSKPQHFMYYSEGSQANNDGSYHILGLPESQMSYTLDGVVAKQALGKALGDTNTLITPPVDTLQEAQVFTTGIPAEIGHAGGGAYSLTTKSGTNELHFSAEERYINKDWLHRQFLNQGATTTPFEYHNFNATLSGPVVIPHVYNGANKTFFLFGYRLDYDHEQNYATVSVPTQDELNGNFSFNGLGYPIYDPKSIAPCPTGTTCLGGSKYTATAFPGNIIPQSRFDPVAVKFLSLNPYNTSNLTPTFTSTGPTNNYIAGNIYVSDRQGYLGKVDQVLTNNQKIFVRYIWNKYRVIGDRNNVLYHWVAIDNTSQGFGLPEPIDERNIAFSYIYTISPTLINELQLGYQRRDDTITPATANQGWASILGIPGVGPATFPGLVSSGNSSFNWSANPGGGSRTLNEDITIADNVTKVYGLHTIKFGYQGMRQRENDIAATQPSGAFTFPSYLTSFPNGSAGTTNQGNSFATFLLGAVSSASFSNLLANYLPHNFLNQFYVQDDWRVRRNLTVSLGVRYSLESPTQTQYGLKAEFSPTVVDPVSGMMGGIIHPKGALYNWDYKNFTPRLGLAWNFRPKFVFRGSFGMFTQDLLQPLGTDEYTSQTVVASASGSPYPAFYLSGGPGPINYNIANNASPFFGTNYSSRNTELIDSNLRNPYSMTWSGGFQYEFAPNYLAELTYQGSAGVHLTGTSNLNTLPLSTYQSTNTTLLNAVYANTQAYLPYQQFGSITETGNVGHSTYNALIARLSHRFSSGFYGNFIFTYSKNLTGGAGSGYEYYDWALTKTLASTDQKFQFVNQINYDLPFGQGRRFMNHGGILNEALGGWTFLTIQSVRSGLPVNFGNSGNPNKELSGEGGLNLVPGQSINIPNYTIGPNVFPQASQNPFYNINAFTYAPAFTLGTAQGYLARTGWVWWPQYSITKTWSYKEKYKLTARMDADNLFPERRWYMGANNTVNLTSPQNFGKFAATTGYSYSNWFGPNGTLQGVLRIAF